MPVRQQGWANLKVKRDMRDCGSAGFSNPLEPFHRQFATDTSQVCQQHWLVGLGDTHGIQGQLQPGGKRSTYVEQPCHWIQPRAKIGQGSYFTDLVGA